jgi:hypothetical protein
MEFFSWIIFVGSNIFGIIPIYSLFKCNKIIGACLMFVATIMSTLMNITHIKYNILPSWMYKYSMIIKYVEKCVAHVAGLYGFYLFIIHSSKNIYQILMPLVGIGLLFGSDYVDLLEFGILQMLWHGCIYTTFYLLADK